MNPFLRAGLVAATLGLALSGVVYELLARARADVDPFDVEVHALEPLSFRAHVLLAPLLVFLVGWALAEHVLPRLRDRAGRTSGWLVLIGFVVLTVGGYTLQVAEEPDTRAWLGSAHRYVGIAWTLAFVFHLATAGRVQRQRRNDERS